VRRHRDIRRQQNHREAERTNAVRELELAALFAAARFAHPDPRSAALAIGIDATPERLATLQAAAEREFPELLSGSVLQVTSNLVVRAMHAAVTRFLSNMHLIAPRDLPQAARNLAAVREALSEGGAKHPYTAFDVFIQGPDGSVERVPPNEKDGVVASSEVPMDGRMVTRC
jgi:hypothetical protein